MNIEEAKANIGAEVVYTGSESEALHDFSASSFYIEKVVEENICVRSNSLGVEWSMPAHSFEIKEQMTWQDALKNVVDDKFVQVKFNGEFENLIYLLETWLHDKEFRLAPPTKALNGNFTKEELLKIVGEME